MQLASRNIVWPILVVLAFLLARSLPLLLLSSSL